MTSRDLDSTAMANARRGVRESAACAAHRSGAGHRAGEGGAITYPAGAYVIKRDQPYGRLAKNLIERQQYPDAPLNTYDDSGWSMGLAMDGDAVEIADPSILKAAVSPVDKIVLKGNTRGSGDALRRR